MFLNVKELLQECLQIKVTLQEKAVASSFVDPDPYDLNVFGPSRFGSVIISQRKNFEKRRIFVGCLSATDEKTGKQDPDP
jgi:hypothetical protein